MAQIQRKRHFEDTLELLDEQGNICVTLPVSLNIEQIYTKLQSARRKAAEAQEALKNQPTEESMQAYGESVCLLFASVFGEDGCEKIVRHYENNYTEMMITLGAISDIDVTMEVYTAKDKNLQEALNELADLVGATWTVTPDRRFRFLAEADFPVFPQTISSDFLLGTDLQHTCRDYKTRTVQIVSGATDTTSEQIEDLVYYGENNDFTTVFPLARQPELYVDGTTEVPPQYIGVRGIDDSDRDIIFFYTYNSNIITYRPDSPVLETHPEYALVEGNILLVSYRGLFPIRVVAVNQNAVNRIAAATGTSGKREQVLLDKTIESTIDAQQLAEALLDRFSESSEEVSFWLLSSELARLGCFLSDLGLLTSVMFELPKIGIVGKYVITARTTEPFAADLSGVKKITFRLTNRDYLKSHAETLASLRRDIGQLSIRKDETVIQSSYTAETETIGEEYGFGAALSFCPVSNGEGELFSPTPLTDTVYLTE